MATHSSVLAWRIPRTEEPGRLQSVGFQRVRHDRAHTHAISRWAAGSPPLRGQQCHRPSRANLLRLAARPRSWQRPRRRRSGSQAPSCPPSVHALSHSRRQHLQPNAVLQPPSAHGPLEKPTGPFHSLLASQTAGRYTRRKKTHKPGKEDFFFNHHQITEWLL